jgi:ROK family
VVTSTGVVLDGVAPPVELMTCSITPTPPRDTVSRSWKWMPDPVGASKESALTALIGLAETSPRAAEVLDEAALYLGVSIGDLINLFNPERIIIGGWAGLLLGERLLPAIREAAREHSLRYPFAQTSIELGRLGPDAVALGAATLPIEALLSGTAFTAKFTANAFTANAFTAKKSDRPAS